MRQLRGSACAPDELCFAGAHHDFGAASLQVCTPRHSLACVDSLPAADQNDQLYQNQVRLTIEQTGRPSCCKSCVAMLQVF